jgi:hypothetical protein
VSTIFAAGIHNRIFIVQVVEKYLMRLSIETKATIKVGPFSRGGYNGNEVKACDHDFEPETTIKPFGIFLPKLNENYFYFTESNFTADFMIDAIEDLWPTLKARFNPHTIVINSDNGPENNSLRTQFIKRLFLIITDFGEHAKKRVRVIVKYRY